MNYDIIIIGGSFAGQAAAMQLGRARKSVLLIDAGLPRNRFAKASHGFPGQDGVSPPDIIEKFSHQLQAYDTVVQTQGEAVDATAAEGGFQVEMKDGSLIDGNRLILAGGVRDILPSIPGLEARWGVSVLHCPYCHGYELDEAPVGVLGDSELAFHQAMMVRDWGPTTLFSQGTLSLTDDQNAALASRGVTIEDTPIVELLGEGSALHAVRLSDQRLCEISGLYAAPRTEIVGNLAEHLGCRLEDGPTGRFIAVDEWQQTSMPGVFAAGDAAAPMSNATISAASGVKAGSGAHASLIFGTNGAH